MRFLLGFVARVLIYFLFRISVHVLFSPSPSIFRLEWFRRGLNTLMLSSLFDHFSHLFRSFLADSPRVGRRDGSPVGYSGLESVPSFLFSWLTYAYL